MYIIYKRNINYTKLSVISAGCFVFFRCCCRRCCCWSNILYQRRWCLRGCWLVSLLLQPMFLLLVASLLLLPFLLFFHVVRQVKPIIYTDTHMKVMFLFVREGDRVSFDTYGCFSMFSAPLLLHSFSCPYIFGSCEYLWKISDVRCTRISFAVPDCCSTLDALSSISFWQ